MLSDKDEIIQKFNKTKAKLLLSVENIGILSFIHAAVFERVLGKYINSGLYMGERDFMLKFMKDMYSSDDFNRQSNQKTWCNYLNKLQKSNKLDGIVLDIESDIFLNHSFTTSNWPRLENKRIIINEKTPCFIQGNGKEDMSYIINGNGYQEYNKHKDEYFWKKIKYNMRAIFKVYNPILSFYVYLCILLVILAIFMLFRWRRKRNEQHFYIG